MELSGGDGYTEFFKIRALETLLDHLRIYERNSQHKISIAQGVVKPKASKTTYKPLRGEDLKVKKYQNKCDEFKIGFEMFGFHANRCLRLIGLLGKYRYKIPYQFVVGNSVIEFRFINNKYSRKWVQLASTYMKMQWADFQSRGSSGACNTYYQGDIINFDLYIHNSTHSDLLSYYHDQLTRALSYFSDMSPLLDGPIESLDRDALVNQIYSALATAAPNLNHGNL